MDTDKTPAVEAAEALLGTLKRMEADGVSAPLRLQYLHESGPAPTPSFDLAEHLAQIEALKRLAATITSARGEWRGAPMDAAYRDAGLALFEHLERLVDEHRNVSGRSEIEMLSSLWECAPADVTSYWPWLHAPLGGPRPSFRDAKSVSVQADEGAVDSTSSETSEDASPEAPADVTEGAARKIVTEGAARKIVTEFLTAPVAEAPREPVRVRGMAVRGDGEDVADGTMVRTLDSANPNTRAETWVVPAIPDALAIKNWTIALNEATAAGWASVSQQQQPGGAVLQWVRPDTHARAVLKLWVKEPGHTHVLLEVTGDGITERAEATVPASELDALHSDPAPFLKALRAD